MGHTDQNVIREAGALFRLTGEQQPMPLNGNSEIVNVYFNTQL